MKNRMAILVLILILFLGCNVSTSAATGSETKQSVSRKKIGLALGGGSAMGFTHIGVLKWLEENHIPVDYVAGTSMGGLMGGFYAMGMSPSEIEQLIYQIDWNNIFNSTPPFNKMEFRRKEDLLEYPTPIELGAKRSFSIPNGLSVYQVNLLLSRLALPYSHLSSFDELPIPYRCVATDIRYAEAVILEDGSLAEAMRATMSIPGVFVPVEREGRLLVDGGLVNNVPADVALKMGADAVIAVNCNESNQNKDMKRYESVLLSSINTVIVDNTRRSLELADVILHPQVNNLSYANWNAVSQFIEAGYQAAAQMASQLRNYTVDDEAWNEYLQQRLLRKHSQPLVPEAIQVVGASGYNYRKIQAKLQPLIGKPINPAALETKLNEIIGSGFYESIRYEMILQENTPVLLVTVTEKSYGPPFIGFIFQTNFSGDHADFNLRSRITSFQIAGDDSELRTDLQVGTAPGLTSELYKPIGNGWFIAPQLSFEQVNSYLFQGETRLNNFKVSNKSLGFDIGYSFNRFAEARFGYEGGNQAVRTLTGPDLPPMNGQFRKAKFQFKYSASENRRAPGEGFLVKLNADYYFDAPNADDAFATAEADLRWLHPVGKRDGLYTQLAAGFTTQGEVPIMQQFRLGGPLKMGTFDIDQLRGENYFLGSVGYLKYVGKLPLNQNNIYLTILAERGGTFAKTEPELTNDLSIGWYCSTIFGTVYLGTSFGEENRGRISFTLGRLF